MPSLQCRLSALSGSCSGTGPFPQAVDTGLSRGLLGDNKEEVTKAEAQLSAESGVGPPPPVPSLPHP